MKSEHQFQAAQGDVLYTKIQTHPSPQQGKKRVKVQARGNRIVFAEGETHTHVHGVVDPRVIAWSLDGGQSVDLLEVTAASPEKPVLLQTLSLDGVPMDDRHAPVSITEPGLYEISRQQEARWDNTWARVAD